MRNYLKGCLILGSIPGVFVIAFFVLRYMRVSGRDPLFTSDSMIVRYLVSYAALLIGGCVLLMLNDMLFEHLKRRSNSLGKHSHTNPEKQRSRETEEDGRL